MNKNNFRNIIRVEKLQRKHKMMGSSFSVLNEDERRKNPWLGSVWYGEGMDKERAAKIKIYHEETERLLKINPKLKIVP